MSILLPDDSQDIVYDNFHFKVPYNQKTGMRATHVAKKAKPSEKGLKSKIEGIVKMSKKPIQLT